MEPLGCPPPLSEGLPDMAWNLLAGTNLGFFLAVRGVAARMEGVLHSEWPPCP